MTHRVIIVIVLHFCISLPLSAQTSLPAGNGAQTYLKNLFHDRVVFDTAALAAVNTDSVDNADPEEAWKQWRLVENYHYGKNRGSLPMIADLQALHPYFREKVIELTRLCKDAGITLAVVESFRTHAKQSEYYAMGKKYTATPGGKSRHQYGLAVDVVPIVDSVAIWNSHKLWRKIGLIGERLGLTWGGRWRVVYDPGHFEWSGGISRYELAKGKLPKIPDCFTSRYQSLETELEMLQTYWKAWETEQSVMATRTRALDQELLLPVGVGN